MNKFVIVSFLKKFPYIFPKTEWPLHVTILRPFSYKGDIKELIESLEVSCLRTNKTKTVGESNEMFGTNSDIPVVELENTPELKKLWENIQELFAPLISFEKPMFGNFRPHVTNQGDNKINLGENVSIKSLSLVKLEDERRVVVCTYDLQ